MAFLYVKAYHGPCNTFNNTMHKPQYLRGLRDRLQKLGYRVDLVPVEYMNYCMLEMCGYNIFQCNIQSLQFNTVEYRDCVCIRAMNAVIEASVKFRRARAYLWFWTLLDHQMFSRHALTPMDHWPVKIKSDPTKVVESGPTPKLLKILNNDSVDIEIKKQHLLNSLLDLI